MIYSRTLWLLATSFHPTKYCPVNGFVAYSTTIKRQSCLPSKCIRKASSTYRRSATIMSSKSKAKSTGASTSALNNYYLLKSEPTEYSIEQLQHDKQEEWDGVRNHVAKNHLQNMQKGDKCFFYHSSCKEPAIVGTCNIVRTSQPDRTAIDPKHEKYDSKSNAEKNPWVSVFVEFVSMFDTIITIKELRAQATINPIIANMTLLKQSRLSVMPITETEWKTVFDLQTRKEQGEDLLNVDNARDSNSKSKTPTKKKKSTGDDTASPKSKTTKRQAIDHTNPSDITTTPSKKKKSKIQTTSTDINDVNYCSDPTRMLSQYQIDTIINDTATKVTEKDLGLKGRKHLYQLDNNGNGSKASWVFFFDGPKFIGKDRERLLMIVDAAKQTKQDENLNGSVHLLLSAKSGICKRKTLPLLLSDDEIVVQRVPA